MWSKIYLAVLGLSVTLMAFFTLYSWSWLKSIGQPAAAAAGYEFHSGLAWPTLWITAAVLLMLGNAVLWVDRRAWAVWATFAYFAVAVGIKYFWLDQAALDFKKSSGLADGGFSPAPFFAVLMIVFTAFVAFADQFLVTRMRLKTYEQPATEPDAEPVEESIETESSKTPARK